MSILVIKMKRYQILYFLAILLLHSCKCDEEVNCIGVRSEVASMIPLKEVSQIRYTNGYDSNLIFNRSSYRVDGPKILDCVDGPIGGCDCPSCEDARISNNYRMESNIIISREVNRRITWRDTVNGVPTIFDSLALDTLYFEFGGYHLNSYNSGYEEFSDEEIFLIYHFLDCDFWFTYKRNSNMAYEIELRDVDSLLQSFSTPVRNYSEVIETNFTDRFTAITSIYSSNTEGIIAFRDSSNVLFYRD